ncbi:MAG TPA: SHOCT domain-containing protein [Gaiellaceae bacterium]|nr:SHOCT domain-containing protein [Gaiellaceae bacterium]
MIALLASTDHWHHWFWLWPLFWLLVLVLIVRFVFRRGRRGPWAHTHAAHDPRTILAQRYARGEIDHDEYRKRLGHLEER